MSWFKRLNRKAQPGVVTLEGSQTQIEQKLAAVVGHFSLILGFVSPHLDIDRIAQSVGRRFPGVPMLFCTTAGELCGAAPSLYCPTGQ